MSIAKSILRYLILLNFQILRFLDSQIPQFSDTTPIIKGGILVSIKPKDQKLDENDLFEVSNSYYVNILQKLSRSSKNFLGKIEMQAIQICSSNYHS